MTDTVLSPLACSLVVIDPYTSCSISSFFPEMMGFSKGLEDVKKPILFDHRPYQLNEDDYLRVCQIPHKKV